MRNHLIASLLGHLTVFLFAGFVSQAMLTQPPAMELLKVGLIEVSPARAEPVRPDPPAPIAQPVPEPLPDPPEPIPAPPEDVAAQVPDQIPDAAPTEREPEPLELVPPDPELPAPPKEPVPLDREESSPASDVDFPEPERVQTSVTDLADTVVAVAPPIEELGGGAAVQASSSEGIDDEYLTRIQRKIGRRWRPTPAGARGQSNVSSVVTFRIRSDGRVENASVSDSSGLTVFDRQALRAVLDASPLPPPPSRFGDRGVTINFYFVYNP